VLIIDGAIEHSGAGNAPWQRMLGGRLEALRPDDGLSPKLRTPEARRVIGDFKRWSVPPSYRAIAAPIGISGSTDADMAAFYSASGDLLPGPPIGPTAELLFLRYRTLAPALLVTTIYFPGRWSADEVSIQDSQSEPRIRIRGVVSERFHETARPVRAGSRKSGARSAHCVVGRLARDRGHRCPFRWIVSHGRIGAARH
jgi:hypothetical protein